MKKMKLGRRRLCYTIMHFSKVFEVFFSSLKPHSGLKHGDFSALNFTGLNEGIISKLFLSLEINFFVKSSFGQVNQVLGY